MARILVSFFNFARDDKDFNIMPPFYESFVNGLKSAGNDVLCFFHKTFTRKFAESIPEEYKNRITDFNHDLCIFFNNSFWNIADIVECPIVIYDVDSVNTFCHKDYIIRNNDRFKFVTIQNSGVEQIENILNISKHNICYIPPFTEIRSSSDILPSKNIIFVGTNFAWKGVPSAVKLLHNNPTNEERLVAAEVLKEFEKYPYVTLEYLYTKKDEYYQNQISCNDINRLAFEVSGLKRLQALSAIADLGLEIRGKYFDVDEVMKYFPEVALSYNNTVGYSLKYNQDLYNNFYIGFNTNHIQAMSGFSWRVCDIMASNACLVSEFKEDLKILFPKVNIPTFTTSYEAREQCKRILSSEYLRADIVGAAHEAIESSFRFKHVLERLEDFLSCSLHGESGHEGTLTIFSDEQNTHQKKAKQEERKNAYKSNHIKCKKIKFLGIPLQFYKRTINNNLDFYYLSFLPLFSVRRKPNKTYYNIVYFEKIKNHFLKYWYKNNTLNIISSYIRRPFNLFFAKKKLRDKGKINVCIFFEVSGLKRLQALSAIADLGLEIRGKYFDVDEVMKYFPEVALSYNNTVGYSLKYNQDLYNNFYIGFNTNHIQAMSGFSWRVCDIMASNACLVSEFKEDLKILFPKVNIPTFTTSYEAREQCKRILSSEYLRADIVGAAHEAIESSFRFKHVLERLEDFLSCSLHGESGHEGTLTIFSDEQNTHQKKAKQEERKNAYKSNHIKCKKIKFLGIPLQFYKRTINNNLDFYYLSFLPLFSVRRKPNKTYYNIVYFEKIKNHFLKYWYKNNTLNIISSYIRRPFNLFFAKKKLRDKGKINVCIFSDRISCWAFDYLYKLFESNSMFNTVIVVAPFMSQGKEAMISFVEQTYERLKSKGYNVIKGYDKYTDTFIDLKKQVNPDILIYNMYWKPHFHENFYIKKFKNKLNFLCEYAFSTVAHKEAKNFEINNTVVGYFEPTKLHLEEDRLWMDNKGANVIVTGSPKLDPFFDEDYRPADVWKAQDTRKKRIIWAPHHSDNFPKNLYQFNAFFELHSFMLEIADTYSDRVQFAFKPHPMLKAKLDVRWGKVIADRYYEQWRSRENTQLEQGEFIDLFLGSDAMIFDGSSFLAEYTATKKPSLFTVGGSSRLMLNNFGKLNFEVIYKTESDVKEEIVKFIEEVVIGEKDIYKEKREKFVDMYIRPSGNKLASENIYNAIVDYLTK